MKIFWAHKYILNFFDKKRSSFLERNAKIKLQQNKNLWNELDSYIKLSKSGGASYSDYWILYKYIRENKPKEVLECGTGVTTIVMAYAMMENEKDGLGGRVTSMEDMEEYYKMACELLPEKLKKYVDIVFSPRVEKNYQIFRGVGYKDIPDRNYEFVYVDGPGTKAPSSGEKTFDFDLIDVVLKSNKPIFAIVDTRMSTCWVFQNIFKKGKVSYEYGYNIGLIGPCSKENLLSTNEIIRSFGPYPVARANYGNKKQIFL